MVKNKKAAIQVEFLPDEIHEHILSRLPVKTILRFMSVCKSWHSLVYDSRFITMHQKNNSNPHLLARLFKTKELVLTDTSSVIRSRLFINPRYVSNLHLNPDIHKSMIVSCNGIVCVHGICPLSIDGKFSDYICLWNPALRVVKYIQIPGGRVVRHNTERVLVGFGFHRNSNDYKVIRYQESVIDKELKKLEIYSLSSDSWRTVKGATRNNINGFFTTPYCGARASGVYVNEAHHWAIISLNYRLVPYSAVIISFNMKDEVFEKISVPNEICKKRALEMILFNYNESLAVLTFGESQCRNIDPDIWVMKDCGMSKSWTKICKIDLPPKMVYFRGFVENMNALIFSTSYEEPHHASAHSIVFDTRKLDMKDDISIANSEVLEDAVEVTTFKESLMLLGSKDLVHC